MVRLNPEERARGLYNVGSGPGLPQALFAVSLQQERLADHADAGRALFAELKTRSMRPGLWNELCTWEAYVITDTHFLLNAVRSLLRYGKHLKSLSPAGDDRAKESLQTFKQSSGHDARVLRNLFEHLDEYWVLGKQDQDVGMTGWPSAPHTGMYDDTLQVFLSGHTVTADVLAQAAIRLGEELNAIWLDIAPPSFVAEEPIEPDEDVCLEVHVVEE